MSYTTARKQRNRFSRLARETADEINRAYVQGIYDAMLHMAKQGLIPKWWNEQ